MAALYKLTAAVGVCLYLVLITVYCEADGSCPSDCQCQGTVLSCIPQTVLPTVNEMSAFTDLQFVDCWYALNVTAIQNPIASSLIIDNCAVSTLPERSFADFANLGQLTIIGNRILSVNVNAFDGLRLLTNLDLSNNKLNALPSGLFKQLTSLKSLDLSGNNLAAGSLDLVFTSSASSLLSFVCNRCGLTDIPTALFANTPELMDLQFNGNNLTNSTISRSSGSEGAFLSLSKLTRLSLEANNVQELSATAFKGLSNSLQYLRLGDNKITDLKSAGLASLTSLRQLTLHNNVLTSLDKESIPQSLLIGDGAAERDISGLELSENPWHCDSSILWLRNNGKIADAAEMKCSSPPQLKGLRLNELPAESFQTAGPSSVAVAAVVLWTLTISFALMLFIRRVYIKRKQRGSPSRYTNVPANNKPTLVG